MSSVDEAFAALSAGLVPERFDLERLRSVASVWVAPGSVGQEVLSGPGLGFRDGRTFMVSLAPGVVACSGIDAARRERTGERQTERRSKAADLRARRWVDVPLTVGGGDPSPSREITEWSRKSRARMVRAFGEVDWSSILDASMPLGMVTLTYPGQWLEVAPTGKVAKRHLRAFCERFRRALGFRIRGAWKLEFQRRGAPHFHLLMPVPAMVKGERFELWLSRTWADVVGAVGEERERHERAGTGVDFDGPARMTDPKRCAVYFLKHGTKTLDDKEYQHVVPEAWQGAGDGPGRFWGFWGMDKAVSSLVVDVEDFVTVRRTLRGVARGRARRIAHDRVKFRALKAGADRVQAGAAARAAYVPRLRSLGVGGQMTGGFVMVNDGATVAGQLLRAVELRRSLGVVDERYTAGRGLREMEYRAERDLARNGA